MAEKKKIHPDVKAKLHPRNKNRERYDFGHFISVCPELKAFVRKNPHGDESIDFANPAAVKMLNKAILTANYGLTYWDIPPAYLCPPIPGRADYIHYAADLLATLNNKLVPTGEKVRVLDIGTGANCIYPIIGTLEYGWLFTGAEIDEKALKSARQIAERNDLLNGKIEIRPQANPKQIFRGIINPEEQFDLTLCNPPFHASAAEAQSGTARKVSNLSRRRTTKAELNFGGQSNELWCEGGEAEFLKRMISESREFSKSVLWFSSLVSKSERLPAVYYALKQAEATRVETISMGQGNKISRLVAWTFLNEAEQANWKNRWK